MQLAATQPMVISEHKRTSYDKDGAVAKVDILRCIRRKDADPSFLPSPLLEQDFSKQSSEREGQMFKEVCEYFLIATIVVCSLMLVLNLCGVQLRVSTTNDETSEMHSDQTMINGEESQFTFPSFNHAIQNDYFNSMNNKSASYEQTKTSIELLYQQFIHQLMPQQENTAEDNNGGINLSEFKNALPNARDKQLWLLFLQKLSTNMNCRMENNKVTCEHQIQY